MTGTTIPLGVLCGIVLGFFYFGGLWLTVGRLPQAPRPHRLLLQSFCIRIVPVMVVLGLILSYQPLLFATALIAFFGVRFLLCRRAGVAWKGEKHASQP